MNAKKYKIYLIIAVSMTSAYAFSLPVNVAASNIAITALKTHWANGTLVFDNATAAKNYFIQKDIQHEKRAIVNACKYHNVTAVVICPPSLSLELHAKPGSIEFINKPPILPKSAPPFQLSPSNVTTK